MLTGKRLFYGETDYQTVELVRAAKIPPIGPQNPEVEPELEEVVRKSLARRPDDRFQSATDLQDALAHYLFSRGLKMIQRDISDLVRSCIEDSTAVSGAVRKPKTNIIDTLLQDEIQSFTSVEFEEKPTTMSTSPLAMPGMPSGEYIDPRGWADDTDLHRRQQLAALRRTGEVRIMNETARPPGAPPPTPSSPPPRPAPPAVPSRPTSRPSAGGTAQATQPGFQVNEPRFHPTPGPDRLAEVLEPGGQVNRKMPKGVIIGVLVGALVIGAAFAAWLVRG